MKRTSVIVIFASIIPAIVLAGCNLANQSTVDRATPIPQLIVEGKKANGEDQQLTPPDTIAGENAVAIHLDAQQRLLLANAHGYCAEPSPDAFSAYVGSLGLGKSATTEAAVSLATALQQSAGSIGLRTQSITLMRDALYRMCEAANNGNLSKVEVARFLRRSQDLTAVVLAIEQLTGAVAASQIILTPQSSADASASLVANQQLVDDQEQRIGALKQKVRSAENDLETAQEIYNAAEVEYNGKKEALKNARAADNPPTTAQELSRITTEADQSEAALDKAGNDVQHAQAQLASSEGRLKDAEEVLEAIQASHNAALTNASADIYSAGKLLSSVATRDRLDSQSAEVIADVVRDMVTRVVEKDDTAELCLSYLISDLAFQRQEIGVAAEKLPAARAALEDAKRELEEALKEAGLAQVAEEEAAGELRKSERQANASQLDEPDLRNADIDAYTRYNIAVDARVSAFVEVRERRMDKEDRQDELNQLLGLSSPDPGTKAVDDNVESLCRELVKNAVESYL